MENDNNYEEYTTTVCGWGKNNTGTSSDVLLAADVKVMSNEDCKRNYPFELQRSETELCLSL